MSKQAINAHIYSQINALNSDTDKLYKNRHKLPATFSHKWYDIWYITDILLEFGGIQNNSLHKVIDDVNDNNIEHILSSSYVNINNCSITKQYR